ncbi:MAG TPA: DUF881 domain-containing protein [Nocardioidaceae bacterium]|nr:DUF881 domain-containing protein [Nocardioidaceae bacterium]
MPEQRPSSWTSILSRPSRGQLVAGVLLAALGFAAVVQVNANSKDDKYVGARQGELISLINNLSLASQRAETEIAQLQQTRNSLRNDTQARRTALERAREQATDLGILAGTLPAVGPGVRITVKDPTAGVGTNQLLNGLEELRDAGAEAIEVNDTVRVVARTAISNSPDGGVSVDGRQLNPPYVIDAIGDPHTLATALDIRGGFDSLVKDAGGTVAVEQSQDVEIASVREPPTPDYAKPASGG